MGRRILLLIAMLLAFACARSAHAAEWRVLSLDEFAFEHYKVLNNRDPYFDGVVVDPGHDGEYWSSGDAALFNVDLVRYGRYSLGIDNRVHGESSERQFRQVGWQIEAHAGIDEYFKVFYRHHSQHILDASGSGRFLLQNFIGAQVVLYKRGR